MEFVRGLGAPNEARIMEVVVLGLGCLAGSANEARIPIPSNFTDAHRYLQTNEFVFGHRCVFV